MNTNLFSFALATVCAVLTACNNVPTGSIQSAPIPLPTSTSIPTPIPSLSPSPTFSTTAISSAGAPVPSDYLSMVWTGTNAIVFGGFLPNGDQMVPAFPNTYALNPNTNSWAQLAQAPLGLAEHVSVWTGDEMLVWGGAQTLRWDTTNVTGTTTDFLTYTPSTDIWNTLTSPSGAPSWRNYETAIWTGSEMIVWGGGFFTQYHTGNCLNDGARYNPGLNTWTPVSAVNAPSPRCGHVAVWTGSEMIIWGGYSSSIEGNPVSPYTNQPIGSLLYDGAAYNPSTDTWTPIPTSNIAIPSQAINGSDMEPVGVWNGQALVIWTGNAGQVYSPQTGSWSSVADVDNIQTSRGAAIWDGNQVVIFTTGQWGVQSPPGEAGYLFNPF